MIINRPLKEIHKCSKHHYQHPSALSDRGVHQAHRNNSQQIWSIFGSDYTECCCNNHLCCLCGVKTHHMNSNHHMDSTRHMNDTQKYHQHSPSHKNQSQDKKHHSFQKHHDNEKTKKNDNEQTKKHHYNNAQQNQTHSKDKLHRVKPYDSDTHSYARHKKSIEKFLDKIKPYTRQLPNSAFRKFYEKPCPQTYGRANTNDGGIVYGNYMKTHNIQPHIQGNNPKKYQTYRSALNFGKRCKVDPDDRWMRIHRQLTKTMGLKFDAQDLVDGQIHIYQQGNQNNVKDALKINLKRLKGQKYEKYNRHHSNSSREAIQKSFKKSHSLDLLKTRDTLKGLHLDTTDQGPYKNINDVNNPNINPKRSKQISTTKFNRQPFYIYKYTDKNSETRFAKDRHGITCYVDSTFHQNDQAYTNFLKKINPIQAQDVKPQDRNIDKIRIANYLQAQQQEPPRHYLMPVVQVPNYNPKKYSFKRKQKEND